MKRAQLEISFQWIFVLIAGAAFLGIFFFGIKSCTQTGDEKIQATSVTYAASGLSGAVWYPQVNTMMDLPKTTVSCPRGTLTLTSAGDPPASASIQDAATFLPPTLGGNTRIVTSDLRVQAQPPLRMGSVLYAMDPNTYYFVLQDAAGQYRKFTSILGTDPNIKIVQSVSGISVPHSATSVVLVSFGNRPASVSSLGSTVYSVDLNAGHANFAQWKNNAWTTPQVEWYAGDQLLVGAALSAKPENYVCARNAAVSRMRLLAQVVGQRLTGLQQSSEVSAFCKPLLAGASGELGAMSSTQAEDFTRFYLEGNSAGVRQRSLSENGCPVIA